MQLVMAYYDNPHMLAIHKREWARYENAIELILVDDGSRKPAYLADCPIPYQHYRVLEDRPWHQNGARNLAMWHAEGWCLVTDMDHLLDAESLSRLAAMRPERGRAYRPLRLWPDGTDRQKRHPNTYLVHVDDYWTAGGYDERWCGYYGTDATFRRALRAAGVRIVDTDTFHVKLYEGIVDDAITRGLGRKNTKYHSARHPRVRAAMKKGERPTKWLDFPWERVR